jgi:3-hydroxyacyl-CoA dehydrogenase
MIRSTAVLGAGTMGAQIAAHFANADLPVLLLDVTRQAAREGLDRARQLKPDPFFAPDATHLISIGSFDEDLTRIADVDWIVEAVVERLDVKRALLERVDAARRPGSVVSSNTSGLSVAALANERSGDFRRHWLGTHFFNPPRYLSLLEIIPGPDTDPVIVTAMSSLVDRRLGKNVVIAKDTPGFIANHIAVYGLVRILEALASGHCTVEEIDAITGPALGRPKSATCRTLDIAGLDVLALVTRNLSERLAREDDRRAFALPPFVEEMLRRGWIGEKAGQGFYQRRQAANGGTEIWTLDPAAMEYRPRQFPRFASLESAETIDDPGERARRLFTGKDLVGEFLRATLAPTLVYTARVAPDIALSIDDCDRAMQWGFGWAQGPFELWDAIGIRQVLSAMPAPASAVPALVQAQLDAGRYRFRDDGLPPAGPERRILRSARERERIVRKGTDASLVDLGDGVLAVEFHSRMNLIGSETLEMLAAGVEEASRSFAALVVGTEAPHFSAGANLRVLLLDAQDSNWDRLDSMVRAFQRTISCLRYADVPVVVAASGLTLGGGCEILLHADRVEAGAELYAGLVEAGVGLIPAGGGTKEMLVRSLADLPDPLADPLPFVRRAFETIAFAKVSGNAPDARRLGYLRERDGLTMNRDRLMFEAKMLALGRVREGYRPPAPLTAIPAGGDGVRAALNLGIHLAWRAGRITDHDKLIGRKLAWIMAGGSLPHRTTVSEAYLLDLEREAFLSLCGERKTLERIQHTLETGKTLRN